MKDDDFLIKLQQKLFEIDLLIDEYEMRDRLLSIFVAGILDPIDDNTSTMKAMYGYSIENREELDTMIDFIKDTYFPANIKGVRVCPWRLLLPKNPRPVFAARG